MAAHDRITKIEKPKAVSELVLERLREDIIQNRFSLGEKVSEAQLSELYGVTKAPIRFAYIRLETEGLLEVRPQAGTFVFKPKIDELKALCELRTALELEALLLAMQRNPDQLKNEISRIYDEMLEALEVMDQNTYQRLDSAFHMKIMEMSESPLLAKTYDSRVNGRFSALRSRFSMNNEHNKNSISEHLQLRDLIRNRDLEGARKAMRAHIAYTERYYQGILSKE